MESSDNIPVGNIGWVDLTVDDAPGIRDFYRTVVGWGSQDVDMGGYSDFAMTSPLDGATLAGVCHARGDNKAIPPQWLIYITVADIEASAARCKELGGEVVDGPRDLGQGFFCVVRDPAGAVAGLFQPKDEG